MTLRLVKTVVILRVRAENSPDGTWPDLGVEWPGRVRFSKRTAAQPVSLVVDFDMSAPLDEDSKIPVRAATMTGTYRRRLRSWTLQGDAVWPDLHEVVRKMWFLVLDDDHRLLPGDDGVIRGNRFAGH